MIAKGDSNIFSTIGDNRKIKTELKKVTRMGILHAITFGPDLFNV